MRSGKCKLIEYIIHNKKNLHNTGLTSSKEDFAKMLGISRASLFRYLKELQDLSLISVVKNKISVCDESGLLEALYAQE